MKFNFSIDDIKYIKVLYKNNDGHPANLKAAIKSIDEKEVVACMRLENEDFSISTPQEITLSIICTDGLYRTQTKLKSTLIEHPYMFLYLESPNGLEYQQNREYFRVEADYACSYYVHSEEDILSYTTRTFDISANGVSIFLNEHTVSEEDSEIDIMINERIVRAKIRYVRSEKIDNGYKISFTYTNISDSDRDYISSTCIQKQLAHKRSMGT